MIGARSKRYARLAVFLGFAVTIQFCFLNPQPEPPASDRGTCPTCYTGGAGGGANTSRDAGYLPPPINPGASDGAAQDASGPRADATESADAARDVPIDAGPDGADEPDGDAAADGNDASEDADVIGGVDAVDASDHADALHEADANDSSPDNDGGADASGDGAVSDASDDADAARAR